MDILTITIAIIGAVVAIQQFLLSNEQFKSDMFEKRLAIFNAIQDYLAETIAARKGSIERVQKFHANTLTASFLFNDEIATFISDLERKGQELQYFDLNLDQLGTGDDKQNERHQFAQNKINLLDGLIDTQKQLKDKFAPYLTFSRWKFGFIIPR